MHRFFIPPDHLREDSVTLPQAASRQLSRVLRARAGEQIILLDDTGWEYLVTLTQVAPEAATGKVVERRLSAGEPGIRITLYQALLKADRFEFVLQKGTELGVRSFVPVLCTRSVPRPNAGASGGRLARWRRIVTEAAEQSRRGRIPVVIEPVPFQEAIDGVDGPSLIPWEREEVTGLRSALRRIGSGAGDPERLSVFVGPEGGFTQAEIDGARERGITPVSLGPRILRAETAGLAAVSAALYELGELGV